MSADPRLSTRVRLADGVSWVAAFGRAHQMPTSSVRVPGQGPSALELAPQDTWQASQGVEFVLPWSMLAKTTVFHSWLDAPRAHVHGRNYGFELFLRRDFTERLGGFLSYTLSRAERTSDSQTLPSSFDRTHVVSAVLGYDLGKGFRLGTRAYFASGRPYSVACPTADCGPGDPVAPRTYLKTGRLANFFRLDIRFEKRWTFASGAWVAGTFEWFNALLAEETTNMLWSPVAGMHPEIRSPITLPSIGIEAGF